MTTPQSLKEELLKEFDELLTSSMINQLSWEKMKESEVLHDMAEKSHSRIKSFLSSAIDKAYAAGMLAGFKMTGEGYNGEYLKGNAPSDDTIREAIRSDLTDTAPQENDNFCTGCAECCPNQEKHKHPFIPLS